MRTGGLRCVFRRLDHETMTRWFWFLATLFLLLLTADVLHAQVIGASDCCQCPAAICSDFTDALGGPCITPCTIVNHAVCSSFALAAACITQTPTRRATRTPTGTPAGP